MRKRFCIALAVVLVALAGVAAWLGLRSPKLEREPVYQGKRLSFWLRGSIGTGARTNAVRQIGTNGIPTLLKMLRQKDSPSALRWIDFWDRHIVGVRYLPAFIQYPDWYLNQAPVVNDSALRGFEILGADAQQAVPALIGIYEQHNSWRLPDPASDALIAVSPEAAIPLFVRDTGSSKQLVRMGAAMALWHVNMEPQLVVPALARLLNDTNINIRCAAARGLRHFGTNAQQAVPALVLSVSSPDASIRGEASKALKAIDLEAAAKAGVK